MVRDLEHAETEILKLVQANYFDKEIKILKDFQPRPEVCLKIVIMIRKGKQF